MLHGKKIVPNKKEIKEKEIVNLVTPTLAGTTLKSKKKENNFSEGSKVPATIFMFLVLIFGFYILYDQFKNKPIVIKDIDKIIVDKIDSTKDYIYYKNESKINLSVAMRGDYSYKDVVININTDSLKTLENKLNKENANYKKSYIEDKVNTYDCIVNKAVGNYENRYIYRDYKVYQNNTYFTLVVIDNMIDICGNIIDKTIKTYIISKHEGVVYNSNSILNIYNTSVNELVSLAIDNRNEDEYKNISKEELVKKIIDINEISLYIDSKDCLGIYYTGILDEQIDDHNHLPLICNKNK